MKKGTRPAPLDKNGLLNSRVEKGRVCEQQIINNAHPIYLARDEVAETPGKRRKKSPNEISTLERPCIVVASWAKVFMYSPDRFL